MTEPEYEPTEPMRGGVHVGSRAEELSVALSEAHAIIWKLRDPGVNIDWNDGGRLHLWLRHYRALTMKKGEELSEARTEQLARATSAWHDFLAAYREAEPEVAADLEREPPMFIAALWREGGR